MLKLTVTSVPAATLPVPVTVDCTTPCSAVTICVDVRAELVGGPICEIASTPTATAARPRIYRCHGGRRRSLTAPPPFDETTRQTPPQVRSGSRDAMRPRFEP